MVNIYPLVRKCLPCPGILGERNHQGLRYHLGQSQVLFRTSSYLSSSQRCSKHCGLIWMKLPPTPLWTRGPKKLNVPSYQVTPFNGADRLGKVFKNLTFPQALGKFLLVNFL